MTEFLGVIIGVLVSGIILVSLHALNKDLDENQKSKLVVKRKWSMSHEEMVYYDRKLTEAKYAKNRTEKLIKLNNEICLNYEQGCYGANLLKIEIQKELNQKSAKK